MGLSVKLSTVGKFLDQPALLDNINKAMPLALTGIGGTYAVCNANKAPEGQKKKKLEQNLCIMGATIVSSLLATRGIRIKGKGFDGIAEPAELNEEAIQMVKDKLTQTSDKALLPIIEKVEEGKLLWVDKIAQLENGLNEIYGKEERAIRHIIPDAEQEGPFADLLKLSWLGLVPVLGGIAGGVIGDKVTKENWKKKFPDKIKEGSYQYLNNICLCNVGAGAAAVLMNVFKVKNKALRAGAMLTGVVGVGIIAGSAIANFIGKNYINPLFDKNKKVEHKSFKEKTKNLNSERHPEAVDLSLHIDDIASVGFLSGFNWIAPILPALYMVSAYRAGEGYRNGKEEKQAVDKK